MDNYLKEMQSLLSGSGASIRKVLSNDLALSEASYYRRMKQIKASRYHNSYITRQLMIHMATVIQIIEKHDPGVADEMKLQEIKNKFLSLPEQMPIKRSHRKIDKK